MLIVTPNFLLQKRGDWKVTMSDTSDLDRQIEQLKRCEIIQEAEVKALCAKAREILVEESNVQRVDSPVTVIFITFLESPRNIYHGTCACNVLNKI